MVRTDRSGFAHFMISDDRLEVSYGSQREFRLRSYSVAEGAVSVLAFATLREFQGNTP